MPVLRTLALAVLLAAGLPASAQQPAPAREFILVVDQSGSMSRYHGPESSWSPNDPDGTRVDALVWLWDSLEGSLESRQDSSRLYRIHVVEFGTTVHVSDPIDVRYDPAQSRQARDRARDRAKRALRSRDLGYTDARAALRRLVDLLQRATAGSDRVHVLLVTDGKPYAENDQGEPILTEIQSAYARDLARLARDVSRGATLDVIGIEGTRNAQAYWGTWGPFWARVPGAGVYRVGPKANIGEVLQRVLEGRLEGSGLDALAAQTVQIPYHCPPYLESITFTFFHRERGAKLDMRDAMGNAIDERNPDVRVVREQTYDRITVSEPTPGRWEIHAQASDVIEQQARQNVVLVAPPGAINVGIPETFRLEVGRQDRKGNPHPFEELPGYPVTARLEIRDASGGGPDASLRLTAAGVFESAQPVTLSRPGDARVRAWAEAPRGGGNEVVTVFDHVVALEVTDKALFDLDAGSSLPARVAVPWGNAEINPRLAPRPLGPQSGGQARLDVISANPERLLRVRTVSADGTGASAWVPLRRDGELLEATVEVELSVLSRDWWVGETRRFVEFGQEPALLHPDVLLRGVVRDAPGGQPFDLAAADARLAASSWAVPVVVGASPVMRLGVGGACS